LFWFDAFTVVDVLTVLPFYVELVFLARGRNVPQFLRVLQLIRIVRIMKVSKGSVGVFAEMMRSSMRLLYMLLFMVAISVLVFGTLIYFVERGRFNPLLGVYEQPMYYMCPMPALAEDSERPLMYAEGASSSACRPVWDRFAHTGAVYMCQYSWRINEECVVVHGATKFVDIFSSTWFVMQTISTVGYGDEVPVSSLGQLVSALIMLFGMVVVSLPITVIGSNFSRTYRWHQRQLLANRELYQYQDLPWLKKIAFNLIYS